MTRITNQILVNNIIKNLRDNMERIDTLSNQLSTGKRVTKPSDDPLAASRGIFYRRIIRENDQFKLNVDDASAFLSSTSATLEDVRTALRSARNIALQGANDASNIPSETMATEVGNIFDNIFNLANEAHEGKYIFAGDKIKAMPFANNGGIVSFIGDNSKRKVETALGVTVNSNIAGEEQFGTRAHKITGTTSAVPTNIPLRVALGATVAAKNILTGGGSVTPGAGVNLSEQTAVTAANFAGFVAGTIQVNNGVSNYNVTINSGDTIGTILNNISSQAPGINAYLRASDRRIILSNDFAQNITVTDVAGNFGALVSQLTAGAGATNSTTQEIFSVKAGTTSMNVVDYVDPDYDANVDLASAISARRLRVGNVNINGLLAGFNRGTTTLGTLPGFAAGTLTVTVNGVAKTITTDADDTMQTVVKRINSQMESLGVRAYVRRTVTGAVNANTLILAGSQDASITVADGGGGNFATLTGITAALGADVRTGSNASAAVDDAGALSLTSRVEDSAGEMTIRQGANRAQNAGGILESLSIADSDGIVTGKDLRPGQIFERLSRLQSALRGRAFGRDTLYNLQDGSKTNLGLQAGDIISFTADTNVVGGPTALTRTVGSQINTLQDLADEIQNFLRTDATLQAQTALVQVIDGRLTITNPLGASVNGAATNVSQPITVTAFSATDSSLATQRTVFNAAMQNLVNAGQIQDDGSSVSSYAMLVPFISQNVSDSISDMDTLISRTGTNQGDAGSQIQKLELTKNRLEDASLTFTTLMSENEDVDMAKAILEFQQQQNVYQAALGAAARILQPTLLDFLR